MLLGSSDDPYPRLDIVDGIDVLVYVLLGLGVAVIGTMEWGC